MLTANDAKLLAIFTISFFSFVAGLLPAIIGLGSRCQKSITLSVVLCFGGGVLLATSLVHILPETRQPLSKWAEVVFCCGFFGIYILDILVQFLKTSNNEASILNCEEQGINNTCVREYGSVSCDAADTNRSEPIDMIVIDVSWNCSNFGLLIAFSVHALLEGLVIGVQTTPKSVLLLLGAVACHKLVVTFCLGAELSCDGRRLHSIIPPISVYVFGSALGIAIGMLLHSYQADPHVNVALSILQGLAGGTLLYIVVSEILPRERSRDLPLKSSPLQFLSMISGFTLMVLFSFYLDKDI